MLRIFTQLIALLLLVACKPESVPLNESFTCSENPIELEQISQLLKNEHVPFTQETVLVDRVSFTSAGVKSVLPKGATCIFYSHKYSNITNKINKEVIDDFPPIWGRATSWDDRNAQLVEKLSQHGIQTTRHVYRGKEWVAWPIEDVELAENILGFNEKMKQYFKEQRLKMYAPNQALKAQPSATVDAASSAP